MNVKKDPIQSDPPKVISKITISKPGNEDIVTIRFEVEHFPESLVGTVDEVRLTNWTNIASSTEPHLPLPVDNTPITVISITDSIQADKKNLIGTIPATLFNYLKNVANGDYYEVEVQIKKNNNEISAGSGITVYTEGFDQE